jgi:hypothetical protein
MAASTRVTSFLPESGSHFFIGELEYGVQNANRPWSITNPGPYALRFELRPGDQWQHDPAGKERSEVSGESVYAAGEEIGIGYRFMVEPGAPNIATGGGITGKWLTLGQLHSADGNGPSIFCIELIGEKMAVRIGHRVAGGNYESEYVFLDSADIVRGRFYEIDISVRIGGRKKGYLEIRRDGELIVDYDGPLGYGFGSYWKVGLYRSEAAETIAATYKRLATEGIEDAQIYGTDNADRLSPKQAAPDGVAITDTGDVLFRSRRQRHDHRRARGRHPVRR